jgi:hypothetical protein
MIYKEIVCIPTDGEEFLNQSVVLTNTVVGLAIPVGNQYIHAIVDYGFQTQGTLLWETGMERSLAPESTPKHRFAGWSD